MLQHKAMKHLEFFPLPIFVLLLLLLLGACLNAQTTVSGVVTDRRGEPLAGASLAVKGSYDGATSDSLGRFTFRTRKRDSITVSASYLGYESETQLHALKGPTLTLQFRLREAFNDLNAVTITAGIFEASDSKRMVMLRPLDIVTTASGNADISSVMQLLPGANRVGEQEGLFVRGGAAYETKTVIDGMIVQNPFFSSTPDVPQRGRFSPFMFKGMAFSTGAYSAQYGQALSSVLLLDTQDKLPEENTANAVLHLAGVGVGYTHNGKLSGQLAYTNLAPFLGLVKTNIDFIKPPQGLGGSLNYIESLSKNTTLKMYATYTDNQNSLGLPNYEDGGRIYKFSLRNRNFFTNNTANSSFAGGKWAWQNGFSYSRNTDDLDIGETPGDRSDEHLQLRSVAKRFWGDKQQHLALAGAEYHHIRHDNVFGPYKAELSDDYIAAFAETEFYVGTKFAVRAGLRSEYSSVIDRANVAPRLSLAWKTSQFSQFSFATGLYYQTPEKNYLYLNKKLDYERADHYILNYQWSKNDRTFRVEAFNKQYHHLVREYQPVFDPNPYRFPSGPTDNSGTGYARGFDVFVRDKKTIPTADFWLTYSYVDTRRLFQNYPVEAVPLFASKHNFSAVYKQFFTKIMTNVGLTYTYTSGRPYYDAATPTFFGDRTKPYHNLSLAASHIRVLRKNYIVFFMSLDNVFGRHNEFGFRYSADGLTRFPVIPVSYRTLFFGVSATFSRHRAEMPKEGKLDF